MPTRRFGSEGGLRPESASDRAVGPIFAAQPQVRASPVRVFFLRNVMNHPPFYRVMVKTKSLALNWKPTVNKNAFIVDAIKISRPPSPKLGSSMVF